MSITLAVGPTSVALPADLYWSDEFTWSPVEQSEERSVTGALILDIGVRTGGRPITLGRDPDGGDTAWITRADLLQLQAWAAQPGLQLTLTLRGAVRAVRWRYQEGGAALDTTPVMHFSDVQGSDRYRITLRFLEA